jgi:hypothetical protein
LVWDGALAFEFDVARFADVGGLRSLERWLAQRRGAFLREAEARGLDVPRGILLLGVQGCGKSLAARAVAGTWGVPLLRLDFGRLYDKYIGETERTLREALRTAETMAPCVLWIDEIEKGLAIGDQDGGTSHRVLGILLTWMSEKPRAGLPRRDRERRARFTARVGSQGPDGRDLLRRSAVRRGTSADPGNSPAQAPARSAGDFDLARLAMAAEASRAPSLEQSGGFRLSTPRMRQRETPVTSRRCHPGGTANALRPLSVRHGGAGSTSCVLWAAGSHRSPADESSPGRLETRGGGSSLDYAEVFRDQERLSLMMRLILGMRLVARCLRQRLPSFSTM